MMRWILALCGLLYVSMIFVGRDHGQTRWGLAGQPAPDAVKPDPVAVAQAAISAPTAAPAPEAQPQAQQLAVTAQASIAQTAAGAAAVLTIAPVDLLQQGQSLGVPLTVTARAAVVREGPGIQYKLVGRLAQGTAAQEVVSQNKLVGWMIIQFDDESGVRRQGYVASRLLSKVKG